MDLISLDEDRWSTVLSALPPGLDLDGSAFTHGALRRRRSIRDGQSLLRLALAYGPCGLSLRGTAAWASLAGVGSLSDVAVLKRLRGASDWLGHIAGGLLSTRDVQGETAGRRLRLVDGTCISHPGSKGTDWRVHASYDPQTEQFHHIELTDGRGAESLTREPVSPGEIYIADRGYARAKGLRHVVSEGGDFVVRVGWRSFKLHQIDGAAFDLFDWLRTVRDDEPLDATVQIDGGGEPDIVVRLVAVRKDPEAAEHERQRLMRRASKKGTKIDPRSLVSAEYTMWVTSLPQCRFDARAIANLYRLRWQVEIAFKRLKSLIHIDRLPAKDPALARTWLYAHLIAALIIDRMSQDILDSPPCAGGKPSSAQLDMA